MSATTSDEPFRDARPSRVFRFVASEMVRFHADVQQRQIKHWDWQDALSAIHLPSGRRHTIGQKAERKLAELARTTIEKHEGLNGKFDAQDLVKEFKIEIGKEIESKTKRTPSTIVKECADRLSATQKDPTKYFVPCMLPQHSMISRFRFGPIQFWRKDKIWSEFKEAFSGREAEWFQKYAEETEYYNWVAAIDICGFNSKRERTRAYLLTELAISAFKILYPGKDAVWFGTDAQLMPQLLRHGVSQKHGENPSIYWKKDFPAIADNGMAESLMYGQRNDFIYMVAEFLNQYALRGDFGFIGNKIVSALKWADIANTHMLPSQRIIAYANCLESLFVTEDNKKRAQICDRATYFLKVIDHEREWKDDVSRFYSARCDLVHGDTSPVDERNNRLLETGKKITDNCVIGMMYFCVWLLRKYPTETTARHESPFNGKGSFTKTFETDLPVFIEEIVNRPATTT